MSESISAVAIFFILISTIAFEIGTNNTLILCVIESIYLRIIFFKFSVHVYSIFFNNRQDAKEGLDICLKIGYTLKVMMAMQKNLSIRVDSHKLI